MGNETAGPTPRLASSGRASGGLPLLGPPLLGLLSLGLGAVIGGCASDEPPVSDPANGQVIIKFLRHDNPNYVTADKAFFDEYMAAHPNVRIDDTTVDFRTLASIRSGDLKRDQFAYDLVLIPPSRVCAFAANLSEVPADVATLAQARELFFRAPLDGSTCPPGSPAEQLKGLPMEYNLEYGGVVVNLDKYEIRFPGKTPGWADWDSFIGEAAALAEYDDTGKPMANGLDIDPDWPPATREMFLGGILQRDGRYWVDETQTFNFNTPQARASLAAMVKWVTVDKIMWRGLVPDRNTHVTTRLAAGATGYGWSNPTLPLSVMGYVGTAGVPSTRAQLPPGSTWRFDYFPVPPMVGTEHRFVQDSGWSFAVPRTSPNQAVAWDIARSLALSPEAVRKWSAVTGAIPALKASVASVNASESPMLAKVRPLLERGSWVGYVPIGAYETVATAYVTNFFAAVAGSKSVDQALADMQRTMNDAINQNRDN
jgi:multiple sugar transport system substrate-binding protein